MILHSPVDGAGDEGEDTEGRIREAPPVFGGGGQEVRGRRGRGRWRDNDARPL